jgi:hypothetical protein
MPERVGLQGDKDKNTGEKQQAVTIAMVTDSADKKRKSLIDPTLF